MIIKYEARHEIFNNVVCVTGNASDQPAQMLEYSMSVKLLTEHYLEFLSLIGGYTGWSESTLCQNATLLEITCHGSIINISYFLITILTFIQPLFCPENVCFIIHIFKCKSDC